MKMKRIARSIALCMLLLSLSLVAAGEAGAVKVYVENNDRNINCDYEISVWVTEADGSHSKIGPVYMAVGSNYTFDTGSKPPYSLLGSLCQMNHAIFQTGRYLGTRWIDKTNVDTNWKVVVSDMSNSAFAPK